MRWSKVTLVWLDSSSVQPHARISTQDYFHTYWYVQTHAYIRLKTHIHNRLWGVTHTHTHTHCTSWGIHWRESCERSPVVVSWLSPTRRYSAAVPEPSPCRTDPDCSQRSVEYTWNGKRIVLSSIIHTDGIRMWRSIYNSKHNNKKASIPVGSLLPACQQYLIWWLPTGVSTSGEEG